MYRVKQAINALTARSSNGDVADLTGLLTPAQRDLFRRMAPNDQRHSLDVCATLQRAGEDDPDLLTAALLHDVGKAAGHIWLWQRVVLVLLEPFAPGMLSWLTRDQNGDGVIRWRRGFVISRLHPEIGAKWCAEAGCSLTTVSLVRRHQDSINTVERNRDRLLAKLQWADGVN